MKQIFNHAWFNRKHTAMVLSFEGEYNYGSDRARDRSQGVLVPMSFRRETIESKIILEFFDYWSSLRKGDAYPLANAIDPLDFKFALGRVSLIDVIGETPRFFLRLIGTKVTASYGEDITGQFVDELSDPASRKLLLASYGTVLETGDVFWAHREMGIGPHNYSYEVLILPLINEQHEIIRLISILDWPSSATRTSWLEMHRRGIKK